MKIIYPILFSFFLVFLFSCKGESSGTNGDSTTTASMAKVESSSKSTERTFKFNENKEVEQKVKETEDATKLDSPKKGTKESKPKVSVKKDSKEVVEKSKKLIKAKVPKKKGRLSFNSDTYDFGFIDMGENVKHEFIFRNTGIKDVNIENVEASCGCTTPSFPFIPIEPGETGKIGVYFKSEGRLGGQTATVTVFSDAEESEMELYLKGVIRTELVKKKEDSIVPDTMSNK